MRNLRKAAEQALEALEELQGGCTDSDDGTVESITVHCPEVIEALRAALAEPEESAVLRARIAGLERRIEMIEAYSVRTWSDSFTLGSKP